MIRPPEALVPEAMLLVGAVRDGGPAQVQAALARVNADELPVLAVVLAAMVDPSKPPSELLGWVPDEPTGQVALWELTEDDLLDRVAIDRVCRGEKTPLTPEEKLEVVRILHGQGMSDGTIGKRLGCSAHTVGKMRKDLDLPTLYSFPQPAPRIGRQERPPDEPDLSKWTDEQVVEVARGYRRAGADKSDPLLRAAYLERERRRAERYRSSVTDVAS